MILTFDKKTLDKLEMLKQSLVQEKLSDLINNGSQASAAASSGPDANKTGPEFVHSQYNMPQWPRVQLDKHITTNLKRNAKFVINAGHSSSSRLTANKCATRVKNASDNGAAAAPPPTNTNHINDNESIEFDGDETVNFYSNNSKNSLGRFGGNGEPPVGDGNGGNDGHNGSDGFDKNQNNPNKNNQPNLNNSNDTNNSYSNSSGQCSNPSNNSTSLNNNHGLSGSNEKALSRESYDLTLRLRYLEKSIKFIQQQHNETLNSLHQEIEKLKSENRGILF